MTITTRARRGLATTIAAALAAGGLVAMATAPAQAAERAVSDVEFRWGMSNEANNRAFAPGTYNLFSAGKIGNPGAGGSSLSLGDSGATWTNGAPAGWKASAGNVRIEKKQADGSYAETSWAGTRTDKNGDAISSPSSGRYTDHQVVIEAGSGTLDPGTDDAQISWDGDFTSLFYSGMTYFTVSDPTLTINNGDGELTATLGGYGTSMDDPTEWTALPDTEVTLATIENADVTQTGVDAVPTYLDVDYTPSEGASYAQTAKTDTNQAYWGSFPKSFVDFQQKTGQASYWFTSGLSTDPAKVALPLSVKVAEPDDLDWAISQRFVDHLSTRTLADGASYDPEAKKFSFPEIASTFDTATGVSTTTYDGSVKGAFVFNGTEFYHVKVDDPIVTVDAAGAGSISAVVSSANAPSGPNPAASTAPKRVTVTTFDAKTATWNSTLLATPRWAGVIPTGSAVESLGIPAAQPIDGKAFDPAFLGNLTSGVRAHFYASGASSDATKAPASFDADTSRPSRSAAVVVSAPATTFGRPGLVTATVKLDGNTAATGVVTFGGAVKKAVALTNGAARVSLPAGLSVGRRVVTASFAGDYFTPAASSSANVTVSRASVTVTRHKITKKPTTRKTGRTSISVRSSAPAAVSGKVKITFTKKGKKSKSKTVTVRYGKASVTIPKLAKGTWRISVKYAGTATFAPTATKSAGTFKVTRK